MNVQSEKSDNTESNVLEKRNSDNGEKNSMNKVEESEEDVPGDFFDDFLKEDFMAGLDIVDDDAWDEDKMKKELDGPVNSATLEEALNTIKRKKVTTTDKPSNKQRSRKSPEAKRRKPKKRKQEEKGQEQKHTKSKEKPIDADEFDIRRDPQKTKRDIERDKVRCEKDKEKKIISEKLSLVETGLVPPGMEMEMDMEEVKRQREIVEQNKPPQDLREHLKNLRNSSKSPRRQRDTKRKSSHRRSASPSKRASLKRRRTPILGPHPKIGRGAALRSPGRTSSPKNNSVHKRSPVKRISPLKRSPLRRTSRSPRRSPLNIRRSPGRRSLDRSFGKGSLRRSRSVSPLYRNRRTRYSPFHPRNRNRSPSRESDREMWLKRRRSRSPRRRRDQEKKSFLQELAEKLNETRPQPVNMMPQLQRPMHFVHPHSLQAISVPSPVPAPVPVPAPNNIQCFPSQPRQQQYDPYDQNFFIGTPQQPMPIPQQPIPNNQQHIPNKFPEPQSKPIPGPTQTMSQIPNMPLNPPHTHHSPSPQIPIAPISRGDNIMYRNMEPPMPQMQDSMKPENKEEIAKLFQDKKITLSEFLAITAKPEAFSSSPVHLQEKIKVITRCHEAIKYLECNEKKHTGVLIVRRTDSYKISKEKNKSPLVWIPPVSLPFTDGQLKWNQKTTFAGFINRMLQKLGLMRETVVDVDQEVPLHNKNLGISPTLPKLSPPPPPLITPIRNDRPKPKEPVRGSRPHILGRILGTNQLSKLIQTDVFKCESCEKRKKILYKASAVQCGGDTASFSVGTQVTEDDLLNKIPKTQSLASLTPAQLLAKSRPGGDNSLSAALAKFNRAVDKESFDNPATYPSRNLGLFPRPSDNYNQSQYSPPNPSAMHYPLPRAEGVPSSPFGSSISSNMRVPFTGGGGRGRDNMPPGLSRSLDPNRFAYNNYY